MACAVPVRTRAGVCFSDGVVVLDIVFIGVIIALVALVALLGKGVERL
jgi:hypothetical protein